MLIHQVKISLYYQQVLGAHIDSDVAKVGNGWAQAQPIMSGVQPILMGLLYNQSISLSIHTHSVIKWYITMHNIATIYKYNSLNCTYCSCLH